MKREPTSIHIDNEDGDVVNQKGETERNLLADDKDHLKAPVKQKKSAAKPTLQTIKRLCLSSSYVIR
jgi:hypothetical protein